MKVFRDDNDRRTYISLLRASCDRHGVEILLWCLMDNHVHFIAVPTRPESLAKAFGDAHKTYTRSYNRREGTRGYLFQGRFGSYVMDEGHLLVAARYILNNPVKAGMVSNPGNWPWSSARFHWGRRKTDPLVQDGSLLGLVPDWRGLMRAGLSASATAAVEEHLVNGRPMGEESFLHQVGKVTGRDLLPKKRGWVKGRPRK
ncbi:MAG: transposase [Planctomycetota bacterium]